MAVMESVQMVCTGMDQEFDVGQPYKILCLSLPTCRF